MQERCQGRDHCLQAVSGSGDGEWTGPGLTLLFQAKRVMEKMARDEESCAREPGGWQGSFLGSRHKGPRPAQPGSAGAAWGSAEGPESPAATSYHPTAGTRVRQAGGEGQSGMKKIKKKPRKENALLRPTQ